jgi:hypothetical protein
VKNISIFLSCLLIVCSVSAAADDAANKNIAASNVPKIKSWTAECCIWIKIIAGINFFTQVAEGLSNQSIITSMKNSPGLAGLINPGLHIKKLTALRVERYENAKWALISGIIVVAAKYAGDKLNQHYPDVYLAQEKKKDQKR